MKILLHERSAGVVFELASRIKQSVGRSIRFDDAAMFLNKNGRRILVFWEEFDDKTSQK